jgi:hypothetical protein
MESYGVQLVLPTGSVYLEWQRTSKELSDEVAPRSGTDFGGG